jgi:hypothetical protein
LTTIDAPSARPGWRPRASSCSRRATGDAGEADAGRADTGADPRRRSGALDLVQILAPAISGAHLLGGSFDDAQRLYVAGFQQGLVTFQFGDAPAVPDPDAVWRAHEGSAVCARMLQTGARAFCTSHTPELWRFDHDAVLGRVSGVRRVPSPAQVALEGMTLVGGTVYVAARSFGLLSHPLDAPPDAGLTPVPVDGALGDAWDVKRLDDDHLVVADGRNGLRVLGRAAGGPAPWRVVGAVPLAGLSAFVTVVGSRAYVAALSGGAHVVELSRPASPERVGTVETGDVVYAAHPAGDMVVVANGGDLLVAAATAEPPRMAIVGRRESVGTALGVTVDRHGVVTSTEFSVVGRYLLRPERAAGAVLQVDRYVLIPRLAPGQAYTAEVTLRNLGDAPLALGGATLTDNLSRSARSIGGPATVAPGDPYVLRVPLTGDAASGARDYLVEVTTAAGGRYPVPLDPFGGLFPGDRLPADLRLRDAAMREHDVNAEFASPRRGADRRGRLLPGGLLRPACARARPRTPALAWPRRDALDRSVGRLEHRRQQRVPYAPHDFPPPAVRPAGAGAQPPRRGAVAGAPRPRLARGPPDARGVRGRPARGDPLRGGWLPAGRGPRPAPPTHRRALGPVPKVGAVAVERHGGRRADRVVCAGSAEAGRAPVEEDRGVPRGGALRATSEERPGLRRGGAVVAMARACRGAICPRPFGPWKSVFKRFDRWSKSGKWLRLFEALRTDRDDEWHSVDSTINRAHQHAAGG